MKAIQDKLAVIESLKRQSFVPYNVIGVLENTDNNGHFDETTETVWVENHYFNYISGLSKHINNKIEAMEDGFYGFSGVRDDLAVSIYKKAFLHWYEPTERYILKEDISPDVGPYQIVKVPIEEAQGIDDRYEYKQDGSLDRIKDAIINRPSSAIYIDGQIASYVLVHEDNSIGYMYTLEAYRNLGLGYWVSLDIIRQIKALDIVPFLEINQMNAKSQGLASKLGFEKDAFTPWFGIIKGVPDFFKTWDPLQGESYIFTSIAQLRVADTLTTPIDKIDFDKLEDMYVGKINYDRMQASFQMALDADKEGYILKIDAIHDMTLIELVHAIAVHFPERTASIILPFDKTLVDKFGSIVVVK